MRSSVRKLTLVVALLPVGVLVADDAKKEPELDGYCPVCIKNAGKWMKGKPEFSASYDGKTYHFPSEKALNAFNADPNKYVPVLGGDCVVCLAKMGKRMPGSVYHAAWHKGRLYLFPGEKQKKMFVADPTAFANVDLALGGNCAVCKVEMKKDVPGKPEHTIVHEGLRYQFPSEKQADMFRKNPDKYKVKKPAADDSAAKNSPDQAKFVSISGTSTCAGCEHGVHPIGAADTLGLAIDSADGKVYVVEDAHKLYPTVYKDRFDSLNLKLTGNILKQEGKFVWVNPKSVSKLN